MRKTTRHSALAFACVSALGLVACGNADSGVGSHQGNASVGADAGGGFDAGPPYTGGPITNPYGDAGAYSDGGTSLVCVADNNDSAWSDGGLFLAMAEDDGGSVGTPDGGGTVVVGAPSLDAGTTSAVRSPAELMHIANGDKVLAALPAFGGGVRIERREGGRVVASGLVSLDMSYAERIAVYHRVYETTGVAAEVAPHTADVHPVPEGNSCTAGMPCGSNGACALYAATTAGDAVIIALAATEVVLVIQAAGPLMAALSEATGVSVATLGQLFSAVKGTIELITTAISAIRNGVSYSTLATIVSQSLEGLSGWAGTIAKVIGASGTVAENFGRIMSIVNTVISDVQGVISACGTNVPPPQNGNPNFTSVGCNQSGGFGPNFNIGAAWGACRSVINNWQTAWRSGSSGTCGWILRNPSSAPASYVQLCTSWVNTCARNTRNSCVPQAGGCR